MTTSPWVLAIDFGTSFTVAAMRVGSDTPESLEIQGERRVPSVALLTDPASGSMVVGRVAEDMASTRPSLIVRAPKRRLGDHVPIVLGGRAFAVVDIVSALLRHVADEAMRHQGSLPARVLLTHPATWSGPRRARLAEAATKAGLAEVTLIAEPVAAALAYAADVGVSEGATVAVYDLGGGTFDTTVLQATGGSFSVVGYPGGDDNLGGELFDELIMNHLGEELDPEVWENIQVSDEMPWRQAGAALRNEARRAKEVLSTAERAELIVPLPNGMAQLVLTRDQLTQLVRPYIEESVRILLQTVQRAGVAPPSLAAVYLVGGSSRMPIIEELLRAALPGVEISRRGDPKTSVALGATRATASDATHTTLEGPPASTVIGQPTTLAPPSTLAAPPAGPPTQPPLPAPAAPIPPAPVPPAPHWVAPLPAPAGAAPVAKSNSRLVVAVAGLVSVLALASAIAIVKTGDKGDAKSPPTSVTTTAATVASSSASTTLLGIPPPSSVPLTTPPAPPPTAPPTTAARDRALKAGRGRAVVLSTDEVASITGQSGWSSATFTPGADFCGLSGPDSVQEDHSLAVRPEGFVNGVAVHTSAFNYASVADTNKNMDLLRQAATACPQPTTVDDGVTYTLSFTDLIENFVPGVDRSISFGVLSTAPGRSTVANVLAVATTGRTGVLLQYQIVGRIPSSVDTDSATKLLAALVAKFVVEVA